MKRSQRGGAVPFTTMIPIAPDQVDALVASTPPFPPRGEIHWPDHDGCNGTSTLITVRKGTRVDRFGPTGPFSDFVATLKSDGTPYSFSSRSLATFGSTKIPIKTRTRNGHIASIDFRKKEYESIYTKENDPNGSLYWIIEFNKDLPGDTCDVAPWFNYIPPPGVDPAQQIKLKEPIITLAKRGDITIYTTGGNYPPFDD